MDDNINNQLSKDADLPTGSMDPRDVKTKQRVRAKKRKRMISEDSSDFESALPENCLEVESNLLATAAKNNLSDESVKKILKKVITNDHVLALVKLREEEESSGNEDQSLKPKLTRSKAKELMKVSTKVVPWNLELTPIKHIHVKTRPEVKALIAQDLPDESDEEYEPNNDDVPSDDDHTLESCSDLDSQPRTPATPTSMSTVSPRCVKDGPFKVPPDIKHVTRKLEMKEEATIALRTRSKLSLSSTSIEHIESSFIPPDEVPPHVDDVWSQFLTECLDPAPNLRTEDDDETDPEYSVAADPDAPDDEDEEALENSIIKISKKELSDLVTELFHVMPDVTLDDELTELTTKDNQSNINIEKKLDNNLERWEGKQEPISEDEMKASKRSRHNSKVDSSCVSIGKREPASDNEEEAELPQVCNQEVTNTSELVKDNTVIENDVQKNSESSSNNETILRLPVKEQDVAIQVSEESLIIPPILRDTIQQSTKNHCVEIRIGPTDHIIVLPEQVDIFQQQLRQHIQLATSNFLQLYVHPVHWARAPSYKEYLVSLNNLVRKNSNSVADVCNLKPALELVESWEKSLSQNTAENAEIVRYLQNEVEKSRRRISQNSLYLGQFHKTFQEVVANSTVFLYPYLLPPVPYRSDNNRRITYLRSEDDLIAIGLDQFWQYVEDNPYIYKKPIRVACNRRWGFTQVVELIAKYMFPWVMPRVLTYHIAQMRKLADPENPINKFFNCREIVPVKHKLLEFNPQITLHEQPENELPLIWLRYLSKTSARAKKFIARRAKISGMEPRSVEVNLGTSVRAPKKKPLPIDFTKTLPRYSRKSKQKNPILDTNAEKVNLNASQSNTSNLYSVVQTNTGAYMIPLPVQNTTTVNSIDIPISSTSVDGVVVKTTIIANDLPEECMEESSNLTSTIHFSDESEEFPSPINEANKISSHTGHCKCCLILRNICKERQSLITDYFSSNRGTKDVKCPCKEKKNPKITNRLRHLIQSFSNIKHNWRELTMKIESLVKDSHDRESNFVYSMAFKNKAITVPEEESSSLPVLKNDQNDLASVLSFLIKLANKVSLPKFTQIKRKVINIFTNFDTENDCPKWLYNVLKESLDEEMPDIIQEFLPFMTPEQGDELDKFGDYITMTSLPSLVKKIEEEISDKKEKYNLLVALREELAKSEVSACDICTNLLPYTAGHPRLAQFLFTLFPHRRKNKTAEITTNKKKKTNKRPNKSVSSKNKEETINTYQTETSEKETSEVQNTDQSPISSTEIQPETQTNDENQANIINSNKTNQISPAQPQPETQTNDENQANIINSDKTNQISPAQPQPETQTNNENQANIINSDKTNQISPAQPQPETQTINENQANIINSNKTNQISPAQPQPETQTNDVNQANIINSDETNQPSPAQSFEYVFIDTPELTVCKTEIVDIHDDSSEMSMLIMSEDECMKSEDVEWTRDQDKLILEVLKQSLTPAECKDKMISELLEENVFDILSNTLSHKSICEIKERVSYLLEILALDDRT